MTTPDHTDVYFTAEFIDGPLAGTAEERVLVRGTHDEKLSEVALVDGIESIGSATRKDEHGISQHFPRISSDVTISIIDIIIEVTSSRSCERACAAIDENIVLKMNVATRAVCAL